MNHNQNDLNKLLKSSNDWQISFNVTWLYYHFMGHQYNFNFNYKKSHCLVIGSKYDLNVSTLLLSGMPFLWANQIKYLGIYVIGGKYFKVDTSTMRRNFFASMNGWTVFLANVRGPLILLNSFYVKRIVCLLLRKPLKV